MKMSEDERSVLEQLEDALLKVGPGAGGALGGIASAGLLKDKVPTFAAFMLGGVVGGGVMYAVLAGLFRLVNANRDRG
jgi:hypothetical protein